MPRKAIEASSNGRTADFGSAYEGSNPSASARPAARAINQRAEVKPLPLPDRFLLVPVGPLPRGPLTGLAAALQEVYGRRLGADSTSGAARTTPSTRTGSSTTPPPSCAGSRRCAPAGADAPVLGAGRRGSLRARPALRLRRGRSRRAQRAGARVPAHGRRRAPGAGRTATPPRPGRGRPLGGAPARALALHRLPLRHVPRAHAVGLRPQGRGAVRRLPLRGRPALTARGPGRGERPSASAPRSSCGACCGLYNREDHGEQAQPRTRLDAPHRGAARACRAPPEAFRAAVARLAASERRRPLFPSVRVCPLLGWLDPERTRVGCLAHPAVTGGPDLRDQGVYDASICETFLCPSHSWFTEEEAEVVDATCADAHLYGLVVTDVPFVRAVLEAVAPAGRGAPRAAPPRAVAGPGGAAPPLRAQGGARAGLGGALRRLPARRRRRAGSAQHRLRGHRRATPPPGTRSSSAWAPTRAPATTSTGWRRR